jgi:PIN domain nuclease of toxin-antitoxin system
VIYLDTHVVAWLHGQGRGALSLAAEEALRQDVDVRVSPMVRLELEYLYEIERVGAPSESVLSALGAAIGLRICDAGFDAVIHEASGHTWTRDPFDRVIVGHAALQSATLVTKDKTIRRYYDRALW